jgi:hypothetical protein
LSARCKFLQRADNCSGSAHADAAVQCHSDASAGKVPIESGFSAPRRG